VLVTQFPTLVGHVIPYGDDGRAVALWVLLAVHAHLLRPFGGPDGSGDGQEEFGRGGSDRVVRALGGRQVAGAVRGGPGPGPTVGKYLAPAVEEGLVPGGPPAGEAMWAQRIAGWFPELSDARVGQ
jgi:hypothetical protein